MESFIEGATGTLFNSLLTLFQVRVDRQIECPRFPLPAKQLKMVQAWIEIHSEELMVDWELAVNGEEPFRIAPLQ